MVEENWWGGILVGNFCSNAFGPTILSPKVIVNYVEFIGNNYHPGFEYHSCQGENQQITQVELSGNKFERATGISVRIQPAVNVNLGVLYNLFMNNSRSALLIR